MLSSKNWRDMFDDEGNPMFDSTDSDNSSDSDDQGGPERTVRPTPVQGALDGRGVARIV